MGYEQESRRDAAVTAAEIVEEVRRRILRGEMRHGQSVPSERDLAKQFGAGRATVRQAFDDLESAGLILRRANCRPVIQVPAPGHPTSGPRPLNVISTALWTSTHQLGGGPILHGIRLRARGYQIQLADMASSTYEGWIAGEAGFLRSLARDRNAAGLIIWYLGGERNLDALRAVQDAGIPIVFVDRMPPGFDGHFVGTDNEGASAEIVRHLIRLGHRRIAYARNSDSASTVSERMEGYREALAEADIPYRPEYVRTINETDPNDPLNVERGIRYFLDLPEPPTAVCAVNDLAALAVHAELLRQGMRVPGDISVTGFDGILESIPGGGFLTTAFQNFERIGSIAARLLLEKMSGERFGQHRQVLVDAPLHLHGSTAPPKSGSLA